MNPSQEDIKEQEAPVGADKQQIESFSDVLETHQKGLKFMESNETSQAIELFSKALEAGCKIRGEMDPSLKVLYLDYGRGLLQKIAETSADILAPIFDKDDQASQHSEKEASQVYDKNSPRIETCNPEEEEKKAEPKEEEKETAEIQQNEANKEEKQPNQSKENLKQTESKEEEKNNRDITDTEATWEILQIARVLGERDLKDRQDRVNILFQADVHMRLGDLQMLRENLDKAMQEYEISLELRKRVQDEKYSRLLAETYFMLGQLVSQIAQKVDQAPRYMEQARDLLLNCLKRETGVDQIKNMREFLIAKQDDLAEVKNLKESIADLNAKMIEIKEDKPAIPEEIKEILRNEFTQLISGFTELTANQKEKVNDLGKILTKKQKEKMSQRMEEAKDGKENKPELQLPSKTPLQSQGDEPKARPKPEQPKEKTGE